MYGPSSEVCKGHKWPASRPNSKLQTSPRLATKFLHMARLWPAYLMQHGPYLARLGFPNEKACMACLSLRIDTLVNKEHVVKSVVRQPIRVTIILSTDGLALDVSDSTLFVSHSSNLNCVTLKNYS